MARALDAVVVGGGPNGLAAAIVLSQAGRSVHVIDAQDTIGGGCRTEQVTLPGFLHDICAAVHPMAVVSPFFRALPLADLGVEWVRSPAAVAHPFDDGTAAVLYPQLGATATTLGGDGGAWIRLMQPFLRRPDAFFAEILKPIRIPRRPFLMARFGLLGLQSCARLVRSHFRGPRAKALFAGCAAHSFLSMEAPGSASFGLVLALVGHATDWPVVRGGSGRLTDALVRHLQSLGGTIETGRAVTDLAQLPASRAVLFDLPPKMVDAVAGTALPEPYRRALRRYRPGPAVFKVDWALRAPIPWRAPECAHALTVHIGPTFEDIAISEDAAVNGRIAEHPFVLVAQQSLFDRTRAPQGHHTGWAYCHVPHGSTVDMTERIERQIERFAPGFREIVLARRTMSPADVEAHNGAMIGGDIGGGSNDLRQFVFRPVARWNPYATPNPQLYLCSSATPPGGGVHGMSGYWAAATALERQLR
jgi:phytoene dehydrogenase-like protein